VARVNVEQKALTDPRFRKLGRLLLGQDVDAHVAQAAGIGWMTFIWNECQERNTYTLKDDALDTITDRQNSAELLITSGLAERQKPDRIRIRGTRDRIEWLTNLRKNGAKGGRPPKNQSKTKGKPDGFEGEKPDGKPERNPPAPALNTLSSVAKAPHTKGVFAEDSEPYRLASLLLSEIRQNDPEFKSPDLQKWAREFDRLLRIDRRTFDESRDLIGWCQSDEFWRPNILSAGKFRKQFSQLKLRAAQPRRGELRAVPGETYEAKRLRESM
jgi:hypothetical protein